MKCIVVTPTYNERLNIEEFCTQILALGPEFHVLVVDDNSPDGTGDVVRRLQEQNDRVRLLHRPKKSGLGTAYMDGLEVALASGADYVAQMDADFSHQPSALPRLLAEAEASGNDVIIGTRYGRGGTVRNWPLARRLLSRCGNTYARVVLGDRFTDYTSGFMLHRASALRELTFCKVGCSNFAFLLEMKVEYARLGASIGEVPIEFVDRVHGASKISFHIIWEAFYIVLHILRRHGRANVGALALPEPVETPLPAPDGRSRRAP